jgi:hypothetical protein
MLSGVSAVAVVQRTRIRLSVVSMTDTPLSKTLNST